MFSRSTGLTFTVFFYHFFYAAEHIRGDIDTVSGEWWVEKVKMKQKELENLSEEMEQENEWLPRIIKGKNEKECLPFRRDSYKALG